MVTKIPIRHVVVIFVMVSGGPETALPHLPRGFGCELQGNGVEVGYYPEIPRLPQIAK